MTSRGRCRLASPAASTRPSGEFCCRAEMTLSLIWSVSTSCQTFCSKPGGITRCCWSVHSRSPTIASAATEHRMIGHINGPPARTISHIWRIRLDETGAMIPERAGAGALVAVPPRPVRSQSRGTRQIQRGCRSTRRENSNSPLDCRSPTTRGPSRAVPQTRARQRAIAAQSGHAAGRSSRGSRPAPAAPRSRPRKPASVPPGSRDAARRRPRHAAFRVRRRTPAGSPRGGPPAPAPAGPDRAPREPPRAARRTARRRIRSCPRARRERRAPRPIPDPQLPRSQAVTLRGLAVHRPPLRTSPTGRLASNDATPATR